MPGVAQPLALHGLLGRPREPAGQPGGGRGDQVQPHGGWTAPGRARRWRGAAAPAPGAAGGAGGVRWGDAAPVRAQAARLPGASARRRSRRRRGARRCGSAATAPAAARRSRWGWARRSAGSAARPGGRSSGPAPPGGCAARPPRSAGAAGGRWRRRSAPACPRRRPGRASAWGWRRRPAISTGISTSEMRKALLRTLARYSRRAMAQVLRIGAPPSPRVGRRVGLRAGDAHEDVVQVRAAPPRSARPAPGSTSARRMDCGSQPGSSRSSCRRPKSLTRATPGSRSKATVAARDAHLDRVGGVALLDGVERAVEHLAPAVDHQDEVAHPLGHLHVVGGKQDGGPLAAELEDGLLDGLHVHRVQAGERLVEDQQLGLVQDGGDELDLLGHALGQRLHPPLLAVADAQPLEPQAALDPRPPVGHALERGEEPQQLAHRHLAVKPPLLGQVADAVGGGVTPAGVLAQHAGSARRRGGGCA